MGWGVGGGLALRGAAARAHGGHELGKKRGTWRTSATSFAIFFFIRWKSVRSSSSPFFPSFNAGLHFRSSSSAFLMSSSSLR